MYKCRDNKSELQCTSVNQCPWGSACSLCTNQKRRGIRPWRNDACWEWHAIHMSVRSLGLDVTGRTWDIPTFLNPNKACRDSSKDLFRRVLPWKPRGACLAWQIRRRVFSYSTWRTRSLPPSCPRCKRARVPLWWENGLVVSLPGWDDSKVWQASRPRVPNPSPTAVAKFTATIDAIHAKTFHVDDETDVVQFVSCNTQHDAVVLKNLKVFLLFIDLGSRSSLEGRTSGYWFGQIVRLVPLFFKLGIRHTLIQPPVVFSLGFFVSPLEERAASLGTRQIKAMSVLVRSRHGKYERHLAKTTHAGGIKAGRSGLVDGMQRLLDPMQIHGHVRSTTRHKTFRVIGNGGTTVIAPRLTSFTFHFVVLKCVSTQRTFGFVLHNFSLFLLLVVVVGRDEHLI